MVKYTLGQIAEALGASVEGNADLVVTGVREPAKALAQHLALAMEPAFADRLSEGNARAAILWAGADWRSLGLKGAIFAPRSRYVLAGVSQVFEISPDISAGVHPTAIVDPTADIGPNSAIGPYVVIGADVRIGANARIFSFTNIAENAVIGENALLYQGVRIGARVQIGDGFICQSNTVIGSDGFSYVTPKPGAVEEARATGQITRASRTDGFARINSLGSVVIGNRVEMGASCTIDRGTIADTVIGDGTKLDNLVQIGHNVMIGQNCLLCGQVGVAGSCEIGDRVVLGGQVGVADHLRIGSDVIVAGKSGISSHVPSGRVMMGSPAMKMETNIEAYKALRRLPRLFAKIAKLENSISKPGRSE